MLISLKKSDLPYALINTDHIIECYFKITYSGILENLPSFICIDKNIGKYRCISPDGDEVIRSYRYAKNRDTPQARYLDDDRVVEEVPDCRLTVYLSGTGGAEEGSSASFETFSFDYLDDFLSAIDVIKEYLGIRIVE